MQILLVDRKAEGQTFLARLIENIDSVDRDTLDMHVGLASDQNFISRLPGTEVIIFGAGIEEDAPEFARLAKAALPEIEIVMFVSAKSYSSGAFRTAQTAKVRKVLPENASSLDLLQELVSIHALFCLTGKIRGGRLTVVAQAKGGVGASTFAAGIAEACCHSSGRNLLWDLDLESRDLCRAFRVTGRNDHLLAEWIGGDKEITRESFLEAVTPINSKLNILMPPVDPGAAMDLVGHPEAYGLVNRIVELARLTHENIIVDTAGRLGPATGALMRAADSIIVVIDDSLLGLSAVHSFMQTLIPLMKVNIEAIRFVCSGTKLSVREVSKMMGGELGLSEEAWSLPSIPYDNAASRWAGTGGTLYSLGQKNTRKALSSVAYQLGMITQTQYQRSIRPSEQRFAWFSKIFNGDVALGHEVAVKNKA